MDTVARHAAPHRTRTGEETRRRLIAAVENILAERGDLRISLREITTAAGTNIAAVNYHFGSKNALITRVVNSAVVKRAESRLAALDALDEDSGLKEVVTAWVSPSFNVGPKEARLLRRLGGVMASGSVPQFSEMAIEANERSSLRLLELLRRRLPGLSQDEIVFRMTMGAAVVASLLGGAADRPLVRSESSTPHLKDAKERTIAFLVGALLGPPASA